MIVGVCMTRVAYLLQEKDNTFPRGIWTPAEMMNYLNHAQREFLNRTGIIKTVQSMTASTLTSEYAKTEIAGDIERISFDGKRLFRVTSLDLDCTTPNWQRLSGYPRAFTEDQVEINHFKLDRIPIKAKVIGIIADYRPAEVMSYDDSLSVKDCWEPYLRWEVVSLALTKQCEAQDLQRANHAHARFMFGISIAKSYMTGSPIQYPGGLLGG